MDLTLPPLPYDKHALAPYISARTLDLHYEHHHRGYLEKLRKAVGEQARSTSLEDLIRRSTGDIFNNAAQVWNHSFYWRCLRPQGGGQPDGALAAALTQTFGSLAEFKQRFAEAAAKEFGSGWAWLYLERGQLKVQNTDDAHTPIEHHQVPLLTLDVWEHAYYLDYQYDRPKYIATFLDRLVNWEFAAMNFEQARAASAA